MRVRVRGPSGTSTLSFPDTATVKDLKAEIATQTGLPAFNLKSGFPPQALDLDQFSDDTTLADTGLKLNGEQLIASSHDVAAPLRHPLAADAPRLAQPTHPTPAPSATAVPLSLAKKPSDVAQDPPEIPVPSLNGIITLRVMADDNSCLFRAVSTALLGSLDSMEELRAIVAGAIAGAPETYTEAVLERAPAAYCAWIQRADSWGGAIELGILAQHFDVEIASVSVQDLRVDRFNEGCAARCLLVYSGVHYDVVALSPGADVPPEFDTKVFDAANEDVLAAALKLCENLRERHYYTDTAGFAIRCNDCGWMGKGEKSAVQHSKNTGHTNFGEA